MDRVDLLRQVPLFKGLDLQTLDELVRAVRTVSFPPGSDIVESGEPGRSLFLILEGTVQVLYPAQSADFELARLVAGDFFGEMAILNSMPRSATVRSVGEVRALALDREDFRRIIEATPSVATTILETLSTRIRDADEQISGLSERSMRDPLTGLLNRPAFQDRLAEEVDRARRYGERFAIILLDVDQFESVNDRFGRDTGDEILRWIGRMLADHTRAADTAFRIGGEEFAILAPGTPGNVAFFVAQRLTELLKEAKPPVEAEIQLTLSAGFSACPEHGTEVNELYSLADQALLRAKSEGKNRVSEPGTPEAH
jgi:diguanylate cyclase (GGDEF)-like protein